MSFRIVSRKMKSPPPKCQVHNEWQALARSMMVGECIDLRVEDLNVARKLMLRGGKNAGFKLTTRKSDHQTLEVYRIE